MSILISDPRKPQVLSLFVCSKIPLLTGPFLLITITIRKLKLVEEDIDVKYVYKYVY